MAIQNKAAVYIDGINLTPFTVMPIKWGNLLDERLDEAYISLRHCPIENFKPLTPVEIRFSNRLYFGSTTVDTQNETKKYVVANDTGAQENPAGSGLYDHDLYIIEMTKLLECIVVDTITFTNDLGRNYTKDARPVIFQKTEDSYTSEQYPTISPYVSPVLIGETLSFSSFENMYPNWGGSYVNCGFSVTFNGNEIFSTKNEKESFSTVVAAGTYIVTYFGKIGIVSDDYIIPTIFYTIQTVNNENPLKRWTITDVINRTLDLAEPLRAGEKPRFYLQGTDPVTGAVAAGSQAEKFDKILAPQFSFTKQTLRECLQECGKVIHGEPRLDAKKDSEGNYYYEVSFDLYGQTERSDIYSKKYILKTVSQAVDSYASSLDSNAENLVNQLDKYGGVIVEPYSGAYKTVRTENIYARITETNMIIPTQFPIYTIEKLECGIIPGQDGTDVKNSVALVDYNPYVYTFEITGQTGKTVAVKYTVDGVEHTGTYEVTESPYTVGPIAEKSQTVEIVSAYAYNSDLAPPIDITPYVFEKTIYDSQLSSYEDQYPYSKAYAVMYTQGQKGITQLNFKPENPVNPIFENYSILNILRRATGDSDLSLDEYGSENPGTEYAYLAFRVTYTPFYNSRVSQTKVNYQDYPWAAALIFNQQSNVIESRYYGENLKGAIARIGNVEKSITYNLARLHEIPEAGQMFDKDYYISAVSTEFLPTYIKCTLGLSKDFNRLSQYIGISSVKRFSEVSQGQALERNILYKEYVVIGDPETADTDSMIGDNLLGAIADTFTQTGHYKPLTNVMAYGGTYSIPSRQDMDVDIQNQTTVTFNNAEKTITFTTTADNPYQKTVSAQMVFNISETNDVTVSFTGKTVTVNAEDYNPTSTPISTINSVTIWQAYYTDTDYYPMPVVNLPVISSAFGNSIAFSWAYEDNYSAGAISQYAENGNVVGCFQNNYQYTDYYGRMYHYNFDLQEAGETVTNEDEQEEIGMRLPGADGDSVSSGYFSTIGQSAFILRKDNREKLQVNVQIDFVSNRKDLIIGSALAAYCGAVRGSDASRAARLYVFDEPLNKFINHVEGSITVDLESVDIPSGAVSRSIVSNGQFQINSNTFPLSVSGKSTGKSWAIVTAQESKDETVEDEEGNPTTQTVQYGGDVLLAANMDITAGQTLGPIYFTKKRKIFDETVWKDIR